MAKLIPKPANTVQRMGGMSNGKMFPGMKLSAILRPSRIDNNISIVAETIRKARPYLMELRILFLWFQEER